MDLGHGEGCVRCATQAHKLSVVERDPLHAAERIRRAWHAVVDDPGLSPQLRCLADNYIQNPSVRREGHVESFLQLCDVGCESIQQQPWRRSAGVANAPSFFVLWLRFCTYTVSLGNCISVGCRTCVGMRSEAGSCGVGVADPETARGTREKKALAVRRT